ncbi:hypothetical protein MY5147_006683 [Beauveria neobassiana]|uniref:Uncharacterized protein n=2 Tax=Beauveria bassiana TaxID=176275 RepID=A0A0A2W3F9_BEABA|nr:hypothetical protein BBAD15_g7165 [Beauveria bassiana D1-5]PQK14070.1 hypothetical protein BB8028_0004g10010 [Beauveria bassiana]
MASSSRSNTIYLKLYLRRRSGVTDRQSSKILFIFCGNRTDPKALVQKWSFGNGLFHSHWEDEVDNPLLLDGIKSAVYGMVDHRCVEDSESELRTLIAVPDKDQQAARSAWLKWLEDAVEEGKRAAAERGVSSATLRAEIEEDNEIGWFNNYFKNYAEDTIKTLQKKGILVPLRTRA